MADVTRLEQFLNHIAHPEDPVPAPQTRMEHNLKEIADNKDEAALPPVSAEDNGKVLAVVNGAWDKAEASGGGGIYVISVTVTEGVQTLSASYNDILSALNMGQLPVIIDSYEDGGSVQILQDLMIEMEESQIYSAIFAAGGETAIYAALSDNVPLRYPLS